MKKSFTLIELIISIAIFAILFLAMSNVLVGLKNSKTTLSNLYKQNQKKDYLIKTLYYDILNADSIKIIHTKYPNYDRVLLKTKNSLYNLDTPNIAWFVSKKNNTLIRMENRNDINFSKPLFSPFIDTFQINTKIFKIYRKNGKDLIFIKSKKPIIFEMIDKTLKIK